MAILIRRREFITALGSAATWPLAARAQQPGRMRLVAVLMGYAENDPAVQSEVATVRGALAKLGWTEGSNLRIELRWGAGNADQVRIFAKELVDLRPDVILGQTTVGTDALARETKTIPIVFVTVGDPVASGFATSLARPSGNITGFTAFEPHAGWKMGRAIEGDRAAHCARGAAVKPGNRPADPILHTFHSSRRIILCRSGEYRPGSREG